MEMSPVLALCKTSPPMDTCVRGWRWSLTGVISWCPEAALGSEPCRVSWSVT